MPEQEPITRVEKFLNGEVGMTPITREEKILAGEDVETITRREYFLKKYRGGGGGDVTVVPLSVTENGTYSEEGKAYSPVQVSVPAPVFKTKNITENGTYNASDDNADGYSSVEVDVPLPQDAYLLKSVTTPTPIATFTDGANLPMPSLKVAIEPQQDLHGYDAPWVGGAGKNKYSILIGADEFNDNVSATHTNNDGVLVVNATATNDSGAYSKNTSTIMGLVGQYSESITYSFDIKANISGSVLVGYTDVGRKTVDLTTNWQRVTITDTAVGTNKAFVIYNRSGSAMEIQVKNFMFEIGSVAHPYEPYSNICPIIGWDDVDLTVADATTDPTVENVYTIDLDGTRYGGELDVINGIVTPAPYYASYNGEALTGEWISDRDKYEVGTTPTIGAQVVNIGASGTPVSILPTVIKSLRGVNNLRANTGDITDAEYFSKEV